MITCMKPRLVDDAGLFQQFFLFLDNADFVALGVQVQRRIDAENAATYDEEIVCLLGFDSNQFWFSLTSSS